MNDRTDFAMMLQRRIRAHAATVSRSVPAQEIARTTMWAATTQVRRASTLSGPRRPALLVGLAALLLLSAVARAAIVGGRPSTTNGVFVDGPSVADGRIVNAIALPDGRVLVGVQPEEGTVPGTTTLRCSTSCLPYLALLDPRTGAFTPAGDTPPSLAVELMALLRDGRVLIVSGSADGGDGASATIYDPTGDRFAEVGDPIEARTWRSS